MTECFRDAVDSPYLWSRDPRSRNVLQAAKRLGADTFEAISFSPPWWLTKSGCSNGNPEGAPLHDNLDPANVNTFVDYLTEVVKYYHENYNISFTSLSPFRMPSYEHPSSEIIRYESCNMERSTMVQVIKILHASLLAKGLTFCSISAADEVEKADIMGTLNYFSDADVDHLYKKVNTQWASNSQSEKTTEVYSHVSNLGHLLWATNAGWTESSLRDMTQGLNLAHRIVHDLRTLLPSAWLIWQAVSDQVEGSTGLLNIPYNSAAVEKIKYKSGYYAMMQFSKYIKKGYSIVHVNDVNSTAAYEQYSETLIIVSVNSGTTQLAKTFDLSVFDGIGRIDAFRTSKLEPHVLIPTPDFSFRQLRVELLPESVTTFKMHNARVDSIDLLIRNGDFEQISPSPWLLMYGSREDDGVNEKYVFRGYRSGFLDFSESKLALMQNVTFSHTRAYVYYLSAWCASSGNGTKFGVLINGTQGVETSIRPEMGYQLYGLSLVAQATGKLTVYLFSEIGNHTAQIDNVAMRRSRYPLSNY